MNYKVIAFFSCVLALCGAPAWADNKPIQPGIDYEAYVKESGRVVLRVNKASSGLIAKGKAVCMVNYSSSTQYTVEQADADNLSLGPCIGIVETPTSPTVAANCVVAGPVMNIDTSSFNVGDILYLSATAGALTSTVPTGSSTRTQPVGIVLKKSATTGIVNVIANGKFYPNSFNRSITFNAATTVYYQGAAAFGFRVISSSSGVLLKGVRR